MGDGKMTCCMPGCENPVTRLGAHGGLCQSYEADHARPFVWTPIEDAYYWVAIDGGEPEIALYARRGPGHLGWWLCGDECPVGGFDARPEEVLEELRILAHVGVALVAGAVPPKGDQRVQG